MTELPWAELTATGIRTTADGPFEEDVFWLFVTRAGTTEVPGSEIDDHVFDQVKAHLPGFAYGKVITASTTVNDRVWRTWHHEESRYAPTRDELAARFAALVARLGGTGSTFDEVYAGWSDPARRYHDVEHLVDCLREASGHDVVELALWYHDVIYDAAASDNEARSADLLLAHAGQLGFDGAAAAELVRATAHGSATPASTPEVDLVLDIDLSILGRDPLRFLEFDHGVAEEYAHVPREAFRVGRARFLASLLARETLFRTAAFRDRFEAAARANITALLASPRYA